VALGATRVIYPAGQKQVQLAVTNNDDNSTYLIQSWVENADGQKDGRFVITPPLFAMQGKREYPAHYRCDQRQAAAGSGKFVLDERESHPLDG
jgi:hypothetical protein